MGLTSKQNAVLQSLRRLTVDGIAPTIREIMADTGLLSTNEVHRYLVTLEERDHIRRIPGKARAIELLTYGCDLERILASVPASELSALRDLIDARVAAQ
jgi:SOS-response transcriptional repressor LexA